MTTGPFGDGQYKSDPHDAIIETERVLREVNRMKPVIKFAVGVVTGVILVLGAITCGLASGVWQQILVEIRPLQYFFHGTPAET